MPPELIAGRYRVEREVGRGGMGSVWLCRDERLGRAVAVKQVGGLPGESSMHLARALREARHSAALNHPNVVAIFDALEEGDHVWLVMEYVPSRTLDQLVRESGPLDFRRAAQVGADVADGLAAAHDLGTVHRDVKPSNILVRRRDGRALIADFGIARTVGQEQLTRSGLVTGTPAYFAPELARGAEPSTASDVWALGVSLYFAVEGQPPFAEETNAIAMLNTIASRPPPRPTRAGPLEEPIRRMMDPDPGTRWSMAQAAQTLRQIADSPPATEAADDRPKAVPILAEPVPRTVRTAVRPDRRPLAGALLLIGVAALALVAAAGWWLSHDPSADGRDTASAEASNRSPRAKSPTPGPTDSDSASSPGGSATPSSSAPPTETSSGAGPTTVDDPAEFVADYYSYLPEDTATSWDMLSPGLQARIGRGTYEGFWATVSDVSVEDSVSVGGGEVQITLVYTTDRGTEREVRQLAVQQTGGRFLISDDEGPV